ncbi:hypothetical protein O6R05_03690 [Peptoniphilus equinus]|uniref:Uncharacterized protein n=1 Tax=Peptoniphilus equinus TaxID=3016343 RepID=A0ABY7QV47_9FIRM|nr:hypothetical protein [Peptoniphilus equinus]WBW50662.1 hypothetical protein O6R05_03690 [Peptoniphilus equinus]
MKKTIFSVIMYTILSYLLMVVVPATEYVKWHTAHFYLMGYHVLAYAVGVIIVLSVLAMYIVHHSNRKQLAVVELIFGLAVAVSIGSLLLDFNKYIIFFLRYIYMVFSLTALMSIVGATLLLRKDDNDDKNV